MFTKVGRMEVNFLLAPQKCNFGCPVTFPKIFCVFVQRLVSWTILKKFQLFRKSGQHWYQNFSIDLYITMVNKKFGLIIFLHIKYSKIIFNLTLSAYFLWIFFFKLSIMALIVMYSSIEKN